MKPTAILGRLLKTAQVGTGIGPVRPFKPIGGMGTTGPLGRPAAAPTPAAANLPQLPSAANPQGKPAPTTAPQPAQPTRLASTDPKLMTEPPV